MASKVEICNIALMLVGAETILGLDDGSSEAEACSLHYESCRDMALQAADWTFARKRVELARLSATPDFGYSYQYQLPSDYLKLIRLNEDTLGKLDYTIEDYVLLTAEKTVKLVYIFRQEDTTRYSPYFVEALAELLASRIAYKLTGNRNLANEKYQLFKTMYLDAASLDSQEQYVQQDETGDWLAERIG